ncbi:MAG: YncE family protein [Candidatus Aenigmarchaeota archaeon]|nr:YncE family protein [Candidatus Aenigmarchaeota archaeon]
MKKIAAGAAFLLFAVLFLVLIQPKQTCGRDMLFVTITENNSVAAFDLEGNLLKETAVGVKPRGIVARPDSNEIYVANSGSSDVSVIDSCNLEEKARIKAGKFPADVAFSPDGKVAYVTNRDSHYVSVIDTLNRTENKKIEVGSEPLRIAFQDGLLYVSNYVSVSVIDTGNNSETARIHIGKALQDIEPAGDLVYVGNRHAQAVTAINASSKAIEFTIENITNKGNTVDSLTYLPSEKALLVADFTSGLLQKMDKKGDLQGRIYIDRHPVAIGADLKKGLAYIVSYGEYDLDPKKRENGMITIINFTSMEIARTFGAGKYSAGDIEFVEG